MVPVYARKAHLLSKEDIESLFEDLHIDVKKANRTYLTIEEIKQWRGLTFSADEQHLERDRAMFLFQLYTGLYYKDLIGVKNEYLVKDHQYGYMILGERERSKITRAEIAEMMMRKMMVNTRMCRNALSMFLSWLSIGW